MGLKFEGIIDSISERQLEIISSVLELQGFKDGTVSVEAVGAAGDNYVANVKRFVVEKNGEIFKLIAKIAPTNEAMRKMMNTALPFKNEHIMYTEVLPKFTELEIEAGIPESERLRYAKCYGSFIEAPNEVITLEDLKVSDFTMLSRFISLSNDTVKLVLKNFARLHSLSYALKEIYPDKYEEFKKKLCNLWANIPNADEFQLYLKNLEYGTIDLVDTEDARKFLPGSATKIVDYARENIKSYDKASHCVIQQGDPWTNNIMFRLEDCKTVECCMIDYQLANHTTPVGDIHYMIFNCTDYEMRSKHYHGWIDYYHSELDKCLSYFDIKVDDVYPRHQLDADMKRNGKASFAVSIMLANTLMRESHEAATLKEAFEREANMEEMLNYSKVNNMADVSKARFKEKVEGLIRSFTELGYLI